MLLEKLSTKGVALALNESGELEYETENSGVRVVAPMMAIETVAAGGGSICWLDGERLRVGPQSAGAVPGPASYGAGGPLALTDVNLLLGRLDPERFQIPILFEPARERLPHQASPDDHDVVAIQAFPPDFRPRARGA